MTETQIAAPMAPLVWEGDKGAFAKAFIAAQKGMESVKKASSNPAFKSKYADLSEVVEAVVPALNEAGIGVLQFPSFDGDMVRVTTILLHETGASITGFLDLRPSKTDPQGVGSATTYGRRYSLLAMTGTAPEDDDGHAASGPREARQDYRPAPPPRQAPQQPKPPTLADRANAFEGKMRGQATAEGVEKVWKLGSGLCAELDTADPERLAELTLIREQLLDQITEAADPFAEPAMEAA